MPLQLPELFHQKALFGAKTKNQKKETKTTPLSFLVLYIEAEPI